MFVPQKLAPLWALVQADALTSARRLLTFALDQQATAQAQVNSAQAQVDMAVDDWQKAKETGDEQKVKEAKEEVKEAEKEVEKAEEKVKQAKKEVNEAEEKVKAQQEKAIRCTASVWSQFSRKMQKIDESYFAYLHILWFKQFCFFSEYPQ